MQNRQKMEKYAKKFRLCGLVWEKCILAIIPFKFDKFRIVLGLYEKHSF